jgi:hypothetical protein
MKVGLEHFRVRLAFVLIRGSVRHRWIPVHRWADVDMNYNVASTLECEFA